jgi:hypothetical protein
LLSKALNRQLGRDLFKVHPIAMRTGCIPPLVRYAATVAASRLKLTEDILTFVRGMVTVSGGD